MIDSSDPHAPCTHSEVKGSKGNEKSPLRGKREPCVMKELCEKGQKLTP